MAADSLTFPRSDFNTFEELRRWGPPSYISYHTRETSVHAYNQSVEKELRDWLWKKRIKLRRDIPEDVKIILLRIWEDAIQSSMASLSVRRQILEDSLNETKDFLLKRRLEYDKEIKEVRRVLADKSQEVKQLRNELSQLKLKQQIRKEQEASKILQDKLNEHASSFRLMSNKITELQGIRITHEKRILEQAELIRHFMCLTTCSLFERQELVRKNSK